MGRFKEFQKNNFARVKKSRIEEPICKEEFMVCMEQLYALRYEEA